MSFISYLKDGISLGSIYAIIALGYTMVYGIAKMLNFAHGDVIMVGAYMYHKRRHVTDPCCDPFRCDLYTAWCCH